MNTVIERNNSLINRCINELTNSRNLERRIIKILEEFGYEYLEIKNSEELNENLRKQLEKLNQKRIEEFKFTDSNWRELFEDKFEDSQNFDRENKLNLIQNDNYLYPTRFNKKDVDIQFIDKRNLENNRLQVIQHIKDKRSYGLIILVNGIPLIYFIINSRVLSDLKKILENLPKYKQAFFSDLFEFIQIFIISNGKNTRYFSPSNSNDKFLLHWSYLDNSIIKNVFEFTNTFLKPDAVLNILTKYCILTSSKNKENEQEKELKILRPYQIAAIEKINEELDRSWDESGGGCIWHTMGSGKTLTSFKTAQVILKREEISKVFFVVDRKDLYDQTIKEYLDCLRNDEKKDNLIQGTQTVTDLIEKMNLDQKAVIITTVQKFKLMLKDHVDEINSKIKNEKIVIVMDECHRSQTIDLHTNLKRTFKKLKIFGFTGTPLFLEKKEGTFKKTEKMFGKLLHEYKMLSAMKDKNVLKLKISTVQFPETDDRIPNIVKYVIDNYEEKTYPRQQNKNIDSITKNCRSSSYEKFNSIFATDNVESAIKYYREFIRQIEQNNKNIKVAIIYYEDASKKDLETEEYKYEDKKSTFLQEAIKEYNERFDDHIKGFDNYRRSISKRVKDREIDILIVIDMFLTGFDAPNLNTLWLDKYLEDHNLIQAFSRTNRISKAPNKICGNIVCFKNLKKRYEEAFVKYTGIQDINEIELVPYEQKLDKYRELEKEIIQKYNKDSLLFPYSTIEEINPEYLTDDELNRFADFCWKFNEWRNTVDDLGWYEEFKNEDIQLNTEDWDELYKFCKKQLKDKERKKLQNKNDNNFQSVQQLELDESYIVENDEITSDQIIEWLITYKDKSSVIEYIEETPSLKNLEEYILNYIDKKEKNPDITWKDHKKQSIEMEIRKLIQMPNIRVKDEMKMFEYIKKWIEEGKINEIEFYRLIGVPNKEKLRNKEEWNYRAQIEELLRRQIERIIEIFG